MAPIARTLLFWVVAHHLSTGSATNSTDLKHCSGRGGCDCDCSWASSSRCRDDDGSCCWGCCCSAFPPTPPAPPTPPTPAPAPGPYPGRRTVAPVKAPADARDAGWSQAGPSGGHSMLAGEKSAKLLGKTIRMTVDVSQAECGCVNGVYLTQYGSGDCDASGSFGRCGEIDLMELNKHAIHTTLHRTYDHPGQFSGFGGVQQPDMMYGQGPRDMTGEQYGPGGSIIDTNRPFDAAISFPKGEGNMLADMVAMLHQDGNDHAIEWRVNKPRADLTRSPPLDCTREGCANCYKKPGCVYQDADLQVFGQWLSDGMTPLSTYWGGQQTWLDGVLDGEQGGCKLGNKGQPGTENLGTYASGGGCGGSFSIGAFTIEDIQEPTTPWEQVFKQMDAQPVIPATPPVPAPTPSPTPGPSPIPTPAPTPGPSPSGCPGGSLAACIHLCPSDPAAYQTCMKECVMRCGSLSNETLVDVLV